MRARQSGDSIGTEASRPEPLWTVRDVARFLNVHPKSIARLVARDGLPCARVGTRLRFAPVELHRWLQARKEG